jgi:signal peptidase I
MSKNNDTSEYRSGHKGGKLLPALCSVSGTLILISVIAVCIPITVPKLTGYEIYNVVSGSMEPEIPVGSAIYVKAAAPEDVQEGEVIAFRRGYPQEAGRNVSMPGAGSGQDDLLSGAESGTGDWQEALPVEDMEGSGGFSEGAVVCHRVLQNQIVEGWFETKGDANEQADMNKIPYEDLIGRVTYHIPVLGGVMALLTGTIGKMYMICFAACGAMLNMLAGRMRERNRRDLKEVLENKLKETKGAL